MQPSSRSPTLLHQIAIAALAFIGACVSHEVLGHGGTCLAQGARITLLTSVYFHCEGAGVGVDLAGPLANLFVGLGGYLLLERRPWSSNERYFLVLTVAFNLFWLAGCMLVSAVSNKSDFAYLLELLSLNPYWLGRVALGTIGIFVYWFGMRATQKHVAEVASLSVAYAVAGVVSCLAALFFVGPVIPALREAALESFGAAIGLVLLSGAQLQRLSPDRTSISHGYGWLLVSVLALLAFILLLGRGVVVVGNV